MTTDRVEGDQPTATPLSGELPTVGLRGSDRIAVLRLGEDGARVPRSPSGPSDECDGPTGASTSPLLIVGEDTDRVPFPRPEQGALR